MLHFKLPKLDFKYLFGSIRGINRNTNEDNHLIIDKSTIKMFLLFDGVGGAKNGRKATDLATEFIYMNFEKFCLSSGYDTKNLFMRTNEYLLNSGIEDVLTTISSLVILPEEKLCIISNIGDTRIYNFTHHSLEQLSVDDRLEFKSHVLTRCLGMKDLSPEHIHEKSIYTLNENFILCTDGFYNLLEAEKLVFLNILNLENTKLIKKKIDSIIEKRNSDDSSYIVIYLSNV